MIKCDGGDLDNTWPTIPAVRSPGLRFFLPGMMFSCHKELRRGSRMSQTNFRTLD